MLYLNPILSSFDNEIVVVLGVVGHERSCFGHEIGSAWCCWWLFVMGVGVGVGVGDGDGVVNGGLVFAIRVAVRVVLS